MGFAVRPAGLPDYGVTGLEPANAVTEDSFELVSAAKEELSVVSEHHSDDGRQTYLVLYDSTAIYNHPGAPAYLAVHVTRNADRRVFEFEHTSHPLVPLAQNWLIERGCPANVTEGLTALGPRPADALTSRLEDLLRTNPGARYRVLDHYTDHESSSDYGTRTSALVHDLDPGSAASPYRVFLEEVTCDFETYTVREGGFSSIEDADLWIATGDLPLPQIPMPSRGRRADAALARTTRSGATLPSPPDVASGPERIRPTTTHTTRRGGR
ncbi:hypothetical protein SAVIM338S_06328 [Streptomyces avidinii]